jgi:hypothetical protein
MAREPKWLRQTGRVFSSLLQAPEDELDDFVRERLDGADIDPARVADAREILIHIGEALRNPTPERLMSLEQTRRLLQSWQGEPRSDEEPLASATNVVLPNAGSVPLPSGHAPASSPPVMPSGPPPIVRGVSAEPRGPSPWTGASSQPPLAMAPSSAPVVPSFAPGDVPAAASAAPPRPPPPLRRRPSRTSIRWR